MNFEYNKIAGGDSRARHWASWRSASSPSLIYAPPHDAKPGYVIAVAETGGGTDDRRRRTARGRSDRRPAPDGERRGRPKTSPRSAWPATRYEKGEPKKVGPNLWGVVGGPAAHHGGFDYSDAMEAKRKEGFTWTFENLDQFLTNPKGFIPGTAMSFAGLKKPGERADVIAYLRTLSDNPVPLPAATAAAAPVEAPATGATAAGGEAPAAAGTSTDKPAEAAAPPAQTPSPPTATEVPAPGGQGGTASGDASVGQAAPPASNTAPATQPSPAPAQ